MNSKEINNYEDLQESIESLRTEIDKRDQKLKSRVDKIGEDAREVLVKKIIIPVGVAGIAMLAAKLFFSENGRAEGAKKADTDAHSSEAKDGNMNQGVFSDRNIDAMARIAKAVLPLILSVILKREVEEIEDEA
ncbi:MAG: hypothetical protein R3275_11995 [Saprospiraceae bacterium]|nr:hypothetical protein [Saprospiraceae bacterium]